MTHDETPPHQFDAPRAGERRVLRGEILRTLGVADEDLLDWRILRKSLDARNRYDLHFIYTLHVNLPDDLTQPAFSVSSWSHRLHPSRF